MLDFLVLGQIPGTNFQIDFSWYLFLSLVILSVILHKIKKSSSTIAIKTKNQPS